mgnify:CR=1 FL=1
MRSWVKAGLIVLFGCGVNQAMAQNEAPGKSEAEEVYVGTKLTKFEPSKDDRRRADALVVAEEKLKEAKKVLEDVKAHLAQKKAEGEISDAEFRKALDQIREGEQRIKDQEQNIKEKLPVKPN